MSAGLALTIALVMLSIMALGQPFAGMTRVGPQAFEHIEDMFKRLESNPKPLKVRVRTTPLYRFVLIAALLGAHTRSGVLSST